MKQPWVYMCSPSRSPLSTRSLWVFPVHQVRALVSCIQPGLVISFTVDNIHVSMLFSWTIPILIFKTKYGPKHKVKNHLFTCSDLFETESRSVVSESLPRHGPYSPWSSPGQNTGVGSLSLLQGIFPTQGSNPGLPYCRWILYQLSRKGNPRILEWIACPCSSQTSRPKMGRGSPALHVDSLPTELSGNCSIIPGVYFWITEVLRIWIVLYLYECITDTFYI